VLPFQAVSRVAALATLEVVVLLGQSGSGKTHLLSSLEVQKMKKAFDLSTVQTHCRSVHTATPYYTWRSILVELISLDLQEADSTQEGEREGVDFSDSTNVNQAQSELPMRLQVILRESENVELLGEEFTENLSTAQGSESGRSPGSQASHKSADLALNERVNTTLAREVTLWMNRHLPDMADLTSLLGIILECESSFEGPVVMPINVMDPEARYRKLEKLMLDILAHVCQRCSLMLVVENVQWMDTRSLKLLHKVSALFSQYLILASDLIL
jgi:predicted ATPase